MINKQIRVGGGVNRSTPIDLKTIDSEVALLSGRAAQTPISMETLWNEVQNLKATAKSWEIVTLKHSNGSYPFDSKYANWNWIVLTGKMDLDVNGYCNRNHNSFSSFARNQKLSGSWSKSGNSITDGMNYIDGRTLTVLFYK